ncbi:uncharacterized protein LOC143039276 [Oratosquilla oratoria]|uniref:uncharacterized protein LOC143039276 n=1 Tax=Oratosquilla oratoria TaxID=337810 RepID=UPI003F76C421
MVVATAVTVTISAAEGAASAAAVVSSILFQNASSPLALNYDFYLTAMGKNRGFLANQKLSLSELMGLVSLCLDSTYFCLRDHTYHQRKGTPMRSPISVVVAEVVMQRLMQLRLNCGLNVSVKREGDTLSTSVYRKPTHTDRLLDLDSYHPDCHKKNVTRTLWNKTDKVCSSVESKKTERKHLLQVFRNNGYPSRTIRKWTKARRTDTPEQRPHMTP